MSSFRTFQYGLAVSESLTLNYHLLAEFAFDHQTKRLTISVFSWESEEDGLSGSAPQLQQSIQFQFAGWSDELITGAVDYLLANPQFTRSSTPPNDYSIWSPDFGNWIDIRVLADEKLKKWEEIKAIRSEKELAGFVWDGSTFDSDTVSQTKVLAAAQAASLDSTLSFNWVLKNNTIRVLSTANMLSVMQALQAHLAYVQNRSQELRQLIYDATSVEELELIQWDA